LVQFVIEFLKSTAESLWIGAQILLLSASVFALLALVIKGREAIRAAQKAARESRVNLTLAFLDALMVAPFIGILAQAVRSFVSWSGLSLLPVSAWESLGAVPTVFAVIFIGDFVSYWRHRLEHTRLLWPAHAVHHSDTEMTWLTLQRFHPINRATTSAVDIFGLALLGFPDWALVANVMLRHYYGEFIHADLPWTYGPLKGVFVSPVMHRWHHARDVQGAGSNFATVFAVFDRTFGTYHCPGLCTVPLGVNDEMGQGTIGQLLYPVIAWSERLRKWRPFNAGSRTPTAVP
jgi:sterol desaturase/sphingolipid hydroxylase (fatty acid hydroxylase superfamily)